MADSYRGEKWAEYYSPNAAMLRLKLAEGGYRVFQWRDQPGAYYGSHKHPEAQSHWVISGELEITVHSRTYVLAAGDGDFMPAGTEHSARVVGDEALVYLIGGKQ